ncbi:unnamed protein product [Rhizophagus irregularis]|nr:unnamed protein product [Rhizophagus irregularis]CAB4422570.1 unnamed protein product [Rhizophagus irregularis]
MKYVGETYCIRVSSASGATNDMGCVRAVSLIFDIKCARVAAYLSGVYDMRRVRISSAYCSSGIIYDARTLSCKMLSNVDRYKSIDY